MTSGGPVKQEVWAPPCLRTLPHLGCIQSPRQAITLEETHAGAPGSVKQARTGQHPPPQADPPSGAKPHARGHLRGWYLSYY